ncbi:MAG: flagellar hook-length control protein FliK, partial [Desulfovibrionaceae bacterium]
HGFTSKEIKEIKEEVASESGLSWGEFMRRIAAKKLDQGQDLVFTPQQKQHLTHLLGKLGFTPEQSEAALRKLSRGELGDVLKQIHGRLQAMPQDSGVTFSRSEMKGLLEACRVPKELQAKFMSYFGDGDSLSGEGLRNALAQLKQDLAKISKEASEKTSELLADVSKALRKAADEAEEGRFSKRLMQGEEANREKAIKQSSGVEKQIADSAEAARQADKAQAAAQSGETASKEAVAAKEAMDKSAQSKAEHDKIPKAKPDSPEQQAKASLFGKQGGGQEHMAADDEAPRDSRQERDALKDLFARFRQGAPTEAKADKNAAPAPTSANMFENIAKNVADKTPGARESLTRQTLHQVQQGVLRNMHGGGKQLTLQLSPESLGRLHVMLQVKNKEIQASIRAESPDTAKMLTENMNALKASLEQQGLKVSKVEVQTGLPQDQFSQQFFGQDRHNEAQRQNELAQKMGRMRLIRQESEAVAQEMQNETEQARFSREGINLIA